jgi:lipid II:glycine glycyltransferase (peptidoglycan interpeptide bridge formation enzyme)
MPFCDNPWVCNDEHPNSPKNLIARGGELELIELEEAELKFNQQIVLNQPDPEIAQKIRKMVKNPTTVRISDPRTAEFVLELQKKFGFGSVAEAIRYCIETVRENEDTFYKDLVSAEQRKAEHEENQAVKEEFKQAFEAEQEPVEEVNKEAAEKAAKELEEKEPEQDDESWNF